MAFEDEAFVLGIEFRRNQVEYLLDVQFVVRSVFGNVFLVELDDFLLHGKYILQASLIVATTFALIPIHVMNSTASGFSMKLISMKLLKVLPNSRIE